MEASAKSNNASVNSAMARTDSASAVMWSRSRPLGPSTIPLATRTMGALIDHRSSRPATSAYTMNTARATTAPATAAHSLT